MCCPLDPLFTLFYTTGVMGRFLTPSFLGLIPPPLNSHHCNHTVVDYAPLPPVYLGTHNPPYLHILSTFCYLSPLLSSILRTHNPFPF